MPERLLQLDDIPSMTNPAKVTEVFRKLGYKTLGQSVDVDNLQLSSHSAEAIYDAHLIAEQKSQNRALPDLQVLLLTLRPEEWESASVASSRMKAIATSLAKKPDNYLLIGTNQGHDRLLLVNPRKSSDTQGNVKVSIRKLLIDRAIPTAYDRDRLEAIAVRNLNPQELYKAHCEAFDVEKLTKVFYNGYRELFDRVKKVILAYNPHPYFEDQTRLHQFSQRLLGRVMFLYFLQKKEFLAGDRRFLSRQYDLLKPKPEGTNYYSDVLEPLFFETLNQLRPNFESRFGKIPYLNGGLFDRDYGEGIRDTAGKETPSHIILPNSLFDRSDSDSILGFFNSYNFTISENVQGDEDVAVDPEMLGKVFENMLEAEERGKSGTFYTPRGIVNFMCVEVLSRYLADETGMTPDAIRELVELDPDLPDKEFNQKLTPAQAKALKRAIAEVKVLDPAVGSGAFPLGMMQVILGVMQAVDRRESGRTVKRGSLTISEWKRKIIESNLYGVDIKPEAIEVAKLRMWLSLVVDIPSIDDVEALPNLDYKLMCGDSLISSIHGEQLIPDTHSLNVKGTQKVLEIAPVNPVQKAIKSLLELQHLYYGASADERRALRQQIIEAEANVFRKAIEMQRKFLLEEKAYTGNSGNKSYKGLAAKAQLAQTKKRQEIEEELNKFAAEVERGERSISFFQYYLHFRDVFEAKGGFDIVIGNPPYVRNKEINNLKLSLSREYECYTGVADLFVYFYEQAIKLLKNNGYLSYISSNKYFRSGYGEKLRKYLSLNTKIAIIIDFGDALVFEAMAYPSIIMASKCKSTENNIRILNWASDKKIDDFVSIYRNESFLLEQKHLNCEGWQLESTKLINLFQKLQNSGIPLGKYIDNEIYFGILTGFNEAFIVDEQTKNELISSHNSSATILKPFLKGRNLKRYSINYDGYYLIKIESSENRKHPWSNLNQNDAEEIFSKTYPAIYKRLKGFKDKLTKRDAQGKYYWELRSCKYWDKLELPKIIYPDIYSHQSFTFDFGNFYLANTCYFISSKQIWICGLLNSYIVEWFYSQISNKIRGGYLRAFTDYIKQIPIPTTTEPERKAIEILVQKCLDAKGQGVEQWEAEIDERVAHLYGLTADEMKIIRGE